MQQKAVQYWPHQKTLKLTDCDMTVIFRLPRVQMFRCVHRTESLLVLTCVTGNGDLCQLNRPWLATFETNHHSC